MQVVVVVLLRLELAQQELLVPPLVLQEVEPGPQPLALLQAQHPARLRSPRKQVVLAQVLVLLLLLLLLLLHQVLELQALLLEPLYSLRRFHPQLQLHFLLQVLRTPQAHLAEAHLRLLRLLVKHHQQLQGRRHQHFPR